MAIYKRDIVDINLETGNIHRSFLNHSIGSNDSEADHFGVRTFRGGEPVSLTGVSVQGVFFQPGRVPISITSGNIVSGNEAEVVLPQACYNYDGQFTLAIKLVGGGVTGTMRIVDGEVDNTHASGTVAPTSTVPTYQEVLAVYENMVDTLADYQEVVDTQNEQISDLKSALGNDNINTIEKHRFVINYNQKWEARSVESDTLCCAIPVNGGESIKAKPVTSGTAYIAYLKTFNPVNGETPDYATGYTQRVTFSTDYSAVVPSDCRYIYMQTKNNGNNFYPKEFYIDKFDFIADANKNIHNSNERITVNEETCEDFREIERALSVNITAVNPPYEVENGYYYHKNGTKVAQSNFCIVTIDVSKLLEIKVYGYQSTTMSGFFFLDSNGNLVPDKNGDLRHIPASGGYNTIQLEVPSNAVSGVASFSISNGRTYTITGYTYGFGMGMDIPVFADVIMIPIFGQSLSVGAAATPVISSSAKYQAGIMFNGGVVAAQKATSFFTEFLPLVETTVETPASGCADKILEQIQKEEGLSVLSSYWGDHHILFVSCGAGSKTISDLMTNYYEGLQHAIQGAKNICDASNLTLNIPCWIWIQGETDQKEDPANSKAATSLADYTSALTTLQGNLNTYAKGVTGQTNNLVCICYQSAAQNIVATVREPKYNNTAVMGVPTAQMQLVRDNASFVASTPVYVLTHSTDSSNYIHLSNEGSKMLGLYCGLAAKAIMFGQTPPTGLVPASYSISGTTLTIKYNVPVPPLRIDTEWVKEVSHYGFALLDSNNTDLITGVSVFDDTVTITCSASPSGATLFYGFNGTQWKDGRLEGSRGNLCDSAKFVFDGEIGGKRYTLGNYAYSFVKVLSSDSGTI